MKQRVELGGVCPQEVGVVADFFELVERHAPRDAPLQRGRLVVREIDSHRLMQLPQDRRRFAAVDDALGRVHRADVGVTGDLAELAGDVRRCQAKVHRPRHRGAARHALVRRRFILRERDATRGLDLVHTLCTVAARPREDDRNRLVPLIMRQGLEKHVDRVMAAVHRVAGQELQRSLCDDHAAVGWDDVHTVGLNRPVVLHFSHGHLRRARQDFGEMTGVRRGEVRDEDERHARVGRQRAQQLGKRFQPAGRRANADHRKWERRLTMVGPIVLE